MTHTPGPWTVLEDEDSTAIVSQVGTPRPYVAWLNKIKPDGDVVGCGGSPEANARLIAKAPEQEAVIAELLEALRDLVALSPSQNIYKALAAIVRAEIHEKTPERAYHPDDVMRDGDF